MYYEPSREEHISFQKPCIFHVFVSHLETMVQGAKCDPNTDYVLTALTKIVSCIKTKHIKLSQ